MDSNIASIIVAKYYNKEENLLMHCVLLLHQVALKLKFLLQVFIVGKLCQTKTRP